MTRLNLHRAVGVAELTAAPIDLPLLAESGECLCDDRPHGVRMLDDHVAVPNRTPAVFGARGGVGEVMTTTSTSASFGAGLATSCVRDGGVPSAAVHGVA